MKRNWAWIAVLLVAVGLAPAAAMAKSDHLGGADNGNGKTDITSQAPQTSNDDRGKDHGGEHNGEHGDNQGQNHENDDGDSATVTSTTYGKGHGHNGYHGLLNALENVKDKPAGATLANLLLTKYDTKLTDEQKAKLAEIVAKDEALSKAAELLEQQGSVTDAVYLQKEAVKANVKNVDLYKKLGKLYEKAGRTGVKLYVNGDEPAAEVAPIIRDGSTLVPFRAISESLKATVSWNADERSVTVTRGDITVKLVIDSDTAYVNGQPVKLDVAPAIENGSTVVPARFVSESLKATVKWEGETQSVVIYEE